MTTKILLTGATGFVGRQVLDALQKKDVELVLVVRSGSEKKIQSNKSISQIIFSDDIFSESIQWWEKAFQNIDIVIHMAWFVEPGKYLHSEHNIDCYKGSVKIAKGSINSKVKRFISIGTCFEYELSSSALTINSPLNPLTPYAQAKVKLYKKLSSLLPENNIEFAWCRLFYLYGEYEDQRRFVPYLRSQLKIGKIAKLSSGKQIRDFMDVSEAGHAIADVALSKIKGAINVCSEKPISIRELAENIADEYGRKDLLNFGAREDNKFDPPYIVGKR
jgi:nucleoside-diphosphate-sugar epimerase